MHQDDELQLIKEAQQGNDAAFTKLFQQHYQFVYHYLVKISFQPDLAEDLVQETMLKAYVNIRQFKGTAKFSTWLISIASRLYMDQQRKFKREKRRVEKAQAEALRKMKWNVMVQGVEWSVYMEVVAELKPKIRTPLLLRHYYGYTYSEIAAMLQLKEGTVKSRVHDGINQIRKEWEDEEKAR